MIIKFLLFLKNEFVKTQLKRSSIAQRLDLTNAFISLITYQVIPSTLHNRV